MTARKKAPAPVAPKRSRSGRSLTLAEREARGIRRVQVELSEETYRRLLWICESSGYSKADVIRSMIDMDYEESQAAKGARKAR
jgi:hypothetical protein